MPRKTRIKVPGALAHIIFRGIEGRMNAELDIWLMERVIKDCGGWIEMRSRGL